MTIEQVNAVMVSGTPVKHTYGGLTVTARIRGVITRYDPKTGWSYSLELLDGSSKERAGCVIIAALGDVEVQDGMV